MLLFILRSHVLGLESEIGEKNYSLCYHVLYSLNSVAVLCHGDTIEKEHPNSKKN